MKNYFYLFVLISWCVLQLACSDANLENDQNEIGNLHQKKSSSTEKDWRYVKGTDGASKIVNFKDEINPDKTINLEFTTSSYYSFVQVKYSYPDISVYDFSVFDPYSQDFYQTDYEYCRIYPTGSDPIRLDLKRIPKGQRILITARGIKYSFPTKKYGDILDMDSNSATLWAPPVEIYSNKYGFYKELGPKSVALNRDFDESRLVALTINDLSYTSKFEITCTFYDEYYSSLSQQSINISQSGSPCIVYCEVPYDRNFSYSIDIRKYDTISKKNSKASYTKQDKADGDTYELIRHSISLNKLQFTEY